MYLLDNDSTKEGEELELCRNKVLYNFEINLELFQTRLFQDVNYSLQETTKKITQKKILEEMKLKWYIRKYLLSRKEDHNGETEKFKKKKKERHIVSKSQ